MNRPKIPEIAYMNPLSDTQKPIIEPAYRIRYLKTKESFLIEVPDPLKPESMITVTATDYDLYVFLRSGFRIRGELDDDAYNGIILLSNTHRLSARTLDLAKTKAHLRRLKRTDTAWLTLNPRARKPRISATDPERIGYLRGNFDQIALNCARHGWYWEFRALCKDTGKATTQKAILDMYRTYRRRIIAEQAHA